MDKAKIAAAFTEWMRMYIEDPEAFEDEFSTIEKFIDGDQDEYGEVQAAWLIHLMEKMEA